MNDIEEFIEDLRKEFHARAHAMELTLVERRYALRALATSLMANALIVEAIEASFDYPDDDYLSAVSAT